jgi:hypothetical protein
MNENKEKAGLNPGGSLRQFRQFSNFGNLRNFRRTKISQEGI